MQSILLVLILLLGGASYVVGVWQMVRGKYAPSVFSRSVWLLLAINSFAGVVLSQGSTPAIALALVWLIGCAAMCVVSFWKGSKKFGRLEWICVVLLCVSGLVWIFLQAPWINLAISLFAHLLGALPTYRRAWEKPESESSAFWLLFFAASVLSVIASSGASLAAITFPLYFAVFEGSMFVLSIRKLRYRPSSAIREV